ncbi:MAG: hypothetical protein ABJL99_17485 [Aliishimia sp.]
MIARILLTFGLALGLASCDDSTAQVSPKQAEAIQAVQALPNNSKDYPQPNTTYLSFDPGHGYQVTFMRGDNVSWLWYPGNQRSLPASWKVEATRNAICWKYGSRTYNPVTKQGGGQFNCSPLGLVQRTKVAALKGDVFNLSSGQIPYRRKKCDAPSEFSFDQSAYRCR